MDASVSFDRAAEYYDASRVTDPGTLRVVLDVLESQVAGGGPVLEIGVGTGQLAVPLAARGVPVTGLDLSRAMMDVLIRKAGGAAPLPLVEGDATQLPFADGAFAAAYARWVLHLIPDWRGAIAEMARVVRTGGSLVLDPGGHTGHWREIFARFVEEVGEAARPVGLDMHGAPEALDEAFAAIGAEPITIPPVPPVTQTSIEGFFVDTAAKKFSWTWRIPDDELARAVTVVRAWAEDRWGDLAHVEDPNVDVRWRAYRLP
jgi:ubiquinone/menaquinone biosynthesis C-methylase UbiE